MKFTLNAKLPTFDLTDYRRRLDEHLNRLVADAAKRWLGTALSIIPVWSGASHATFSHLAQEAGFPLRIRPRGGVYDGADDGLYTSDGQIENDGNGKVYFLYTTSLKHLIYNEFNNANATPDPGLFGSLLRPGPYRFQDRAAEAFKAVAANARLPDPFDSLRVKTVRFG